MMMMKDRPSTLDALQTGSSRTFLLTGRFKHEQQVPVNLRRKQFDFLLESHLILTEFVYRILTFIQVSQRQMFFYYYFEIKV